MTRSSADILARLRSREPLLFDFGVEVLVSRLGFEDAKPWLRPEATPESWAAAQMPNTPEAAVEELLAYLPFAWEKARGERGLSAVRSLQKITEWCWLLGEDELVAFAGDDANYVPYGIPVLRRVSDHFGVADEVV